MKKSLMYAAVGCFVVTGSAQALDVTLSGQISRMVVLPDDAEGDEIQFQDIGWSGSRFRFIGTQDINEAYKLGFRYEVQLQSNPSFSSTGGGQTNGGNDDFLDNRIQDIWFSGSFGKIALGKGDGASNGSTESDLSGTALSSSSNHQDNWGNYRVVAGVDGEPGVTWDSIFTMNDGLSRVNRLRYDTPSFNGFVAAASLGQGGATELGLKYKGDLAGIKIDGRAFFANADDFADDADIIGFSASALHSSGINLTVAYADRDNDTGQDQEATTVKLGYKRGIHAITVDYGDGETGDIDADTVGLTYAATPISGWEMFATVRQLDADIGDSDSVDLVALGSRLKF